jgi:hypothetical protein
MRAQIAAQNHCSACILLRVHPLIGNWLVNKFLLNSLLLGYATILTTEELFSMWSTQCPVLSNKSVNLSTIVHVFYGVHAKDF